MAVTDVRTALADQRRARQQRSWWSILKTSASEWSDADAMTWAAAIACYTVLALAPLLVVAVKIAGVLLAGHADPVKTIHDDVASLMGTSQGAEAIAAILDKVVSQKGGLLASIVSSVLVIISVGGVFSEIQQAMNRVWKLKPKPGRAMAAFIGARLKSVVVLAIAAIVLLASLAVAGWLQKLTSHFGAGGAVLVWVIDLIANLIAFTIIFGLVFKTVPDASIGWRTTVIGSILTAVLFAIGKYGLALYFKYGTPTSAFGAVGSLAAILIWIYYSAQIVLFGAVFTQVFSKQRGHGVKPSRHAQFLSECDETETATPSPETVANKPPRPGLHPHARWPNGDYSAVLARHAESSLRIPPASVGKLPVEEQMVARSLLAAGAGLALGALLGGYGALQLRRPPAVDPKRQATAALRRRLDRVEQKIGRASRIKRFLEQEDVNERLDAIRDRIQGTAKKQRLNRSMKRSRPSWSERVVHAMKNLF